MRCSIKLNIDMELNEIALGNDILTRCNLRANLLRANLFCTLINLVPSN